MRIRQVKTKLSVDDDWTYERIKLDLQERIDIL
jgi:hypothetical protein